MKLVSLALLLASISPMLWAQTPELKTSVTQLSGKEEPICIMEDSVPFCARYDISGLHSNWPWLNELIRKRVEKDQPVLTAKHLPVPKDFPERTEGNNQRQYDVSLSSHYRDLVSIQYAGWDYGQGAAHGNPYFSYVTYDAKTQQAVSFKDMVLPAKRAQLEQALSRSFAAWLQDQDGAGQEQPKITDDVVFTPDGVMFYYNVYALGPYAMGAPELKLTWKQVLPMLKPQWRQRLQ